MTEEDEKLAYLSGLLDGVFIIREMVRKCTLTKTSARLPGELEMIYDCICEKFNRHLLEWLTDDRCPPNNASNSEINENTSAPSGVRP